MYYFIFYEYNIFIKINGQCILSILFIARATNNELLKPPKNPITDE